MTDMKHVPTQRAEWLVGLAIYGTAVAGVAALIIALFAFLGGRWDVAGTCLVAAAIAFGALANALLRA
jgi:hypothetical protein